ncbi:amidase [Paenibacillus humicola]|uniref:amidase n=1 Tax=Paenibacillus humicola TaxID=3110540 RepID=UPI00237C3836|nr:amidase [Paenibacillus humicola]
MSKSLADSTIQELAPLLQSKTVSPVELTEAVLARMEETEGRLNAYITRLEDEAMADAREAEREIVNGGYKGPLHGIPFAVKDLYYTKGIRTTAGSKIYRDFVPDYDATTVARLKDAGAILVGKNNTHEFASGGTNENEHFGPARNPWNPDRIPGGSSGGSAACVAASSAIFSLGTDTGGSIRMPASLCGIVGMKATYGRVSRRGVFPLSWSLDHAGPLAKSVWDTAQVLSVIAGQDPLDAASSDHPVPDYAAALNSGVSRPLEGMKIGYCEAYFFQNLDPEVERLVKQAIAVLADLGAEIREVKIPMLEQMVQVHSLISAAEMLTFHNANVTSRSEDYGTNILPRLLMAKEISAQAYLETQRLRQQYQAVWSELYREIDLLAVPSTGIPAFPIGAETIHLNGKDVNPRDIGIIGRTAPGNFNGYPSISVPCGYTDAGLPVGLQIQGVPFDESLVFQAAHAYEQATLWFSKQVPAVLQDDFPGKSPDTRQEMGASVSPVHKSIDSIMDVLTELSSQLAAEIEPASCFKPKTVNKETKQVTSISL